MESSDGGSRTSGHPTNWNFKQCLETYQLSDGDDEEDSDQLWNMNLDCVYHDIDDMKHFANNSPKYAAIQVNVLKLPNKYDKIRSIICRLMDYGIVIDFIILCET